MICKQIYTLLLLGGVIPVACWIEADHHLTTTAAEGAEPSDYSTNGLTDIFSSNSSTAPLLPTEKLEAVGSDSSLAPDRRELIEKPLQVNKGDKMNIVNVKLPSQLNIQEVQRDWQKYKNLSSVLSSKTQQLGDSLHSLEQSMVADDTRDKLMSELRMMKLIMALLRSVRKAETPVVKENGKVMFNASKINFNVENGHIDIMMGEEHSAGVVSSAVNLTNVTASLNSTVGAASDAKLWNTLGWVVLLSTVTAAVILGCAFSIVQCIPIDANKMKNDMKPKYNQIRWGNDSSGEPAVIHPEKFLLLEVFDVFRFSCPPSKSAAAHGPILYQSDDCGQHKPGGESYSRLLRKMGNTFENPIHGNCQHCRDMRLGWVRAKLDELKYTGDNKAWYSQNKCLPKSGHKFRQKDHNAVMSSTVPDYFDDCCEIDLPKFMEGLPLLPHMKETGGRLHRVKSRDIEKELDLPVLPHERGTER